MWSGLGLKNNFLFAPIKAVLDYQDEGTTGDISAALELKGQKKRH